MVKELVRKKVNTCLADYYQSEAGSVVPVYALEEPPKQMGADLSLNIAMISAKLLKKPPKKIAEDIIKILLSPENKNIIATAAIAGPGFINIQLSDEILHKTLQVPADPGTRKEKSSTKTLIEFISANPTGPLHIGHGRGAALGDSLCRIMRYCGLSVDTEYYVNNIGNQIQTLGASVLARIKELRGEKQEFPPDGYQGDYVIEIAKKLYAEDKVPDLKKTQQFAVDEILRSIRDDCRRFRISFTSWFFESQLYKDNKVDELLQSLTTQKHVYSKDNALWLKSTAYGDEKDRVVKRADGRLTYLASDIAYHKEKFERGYKKVINIWGADHHGYVKRVKAAVSALGESSEKLHVLLYQLVSLTRAGKPAAMSTRAGQFVTLREVLDEVGPDACRFFFAMRSPQSQLEFDLELAKKKSNENPVFYVQYVHARICSIFREAKKNGIKISQNFSAELLKTTEERNLMKKMAFFSDTLTLCINEESPHHLTRYVLDIAGLFHKFYDTCRVLTDDHALTAARLGLIQAVKKTIAVGLDLLGVSAPEKM